MIEFPEALSRAKELNGILTGKTVSKVYLPSSPHKFCWFNGDVTAYGEQLEGKTVLEAEGFGIYVELAFTEGTKLCFNDGVNVKWIKKGGLLPKKYQLCLEFTQGDILAFSVSMYGGIICHKGDYANEYYCKSRESLSPLEEAFDSVYFEQLFSGVKPGMSVKAFLATEQRIPGVGNGCLQDILFQAGIHPKRKIGTISREEREKLFCSVKTVLKKMTEQGGRDTEKDIYGNPGGYTTKLSKNSYAGGCPVCGGPVTKETYLGGTVYYCPVCQRMK